MKAKGYSLSPTSGSKILKKNKPVKSSWQELVFQYPCSIFSNCDFESCVKSCKSGKMFVRVLFPQNFTVWSFMKMNLSPKGYEGIILRQIYWIKEVIDDNYGISHHRICWNKKGGSCFSYFFFFQQKNCVCSIIWQHLPPHSFLSEYWKPDHFKLAYSGTGKV